MAQFDQQSNNSSSTLSTAYFFFFSFGEIWTVPFLLFQERKIQNLDSHLYVPGKSYSRGWPRVVVELLPQKWKGQRAKSKE